MNKRIIVSLVALVCINHVHGAARATFKPVKLEDGRESATPSPELKIQFGVQQQIGWGEWLFGSTEKKPMLVPMTDIQTYIAASKKVAVSQIRDEDAHWEFSFKVKNGDVSALRISKEQYNSLPAATKKSLPVLSDIISADLESDND